MTVLSARPNPPASQAQSVDYSITAGTTPTTVTFNRGDLKHYVRIWNVSATATIWLSRTGQPAAPNQAGSYPLAPGIFEVFQSPQAIPVEPVSIVATAAGTPVTITAGGLAP